MKVRKYIRGLAIMTTLAGCRGGSAISDRTPAPAPMPTKATFN